MSTISIAQNFTVNQVGFISKTDCFVNVQKRKELVQFRSTSSSQNINLSFVQSENLNSSTNLTVNDRSTSLVGNRFLTELDYQILEDIPGFSIETDLFYLTDIFTVNLTTQQRLPLFFKHELQRTLEAGEAYNNVQLLDQTFTPVLTSRYLVDLTAATVYSNLENKFDQSTGLSEIYFVSYTVRKTNGILEQYTEILNHEPVFSVADLDDLDLDTGTILPNRKVYLIQEDIGEQFNVTLPLSGTYGLLRSSSSRIEILPPAATTTSDPWFVRVRSGKFLSSGATGIKKFYVSEFSSQFFNPYYPYKQADETSYRVSTRIIKTIKNRIALSDTEALYPEVVVYKSDGSFKFALTSNPTMLGQAAFTSDAYYANVLLGSSKVTGTGINATTDAISGSSIDTWGGFIALPAGYEISETDTIRTRYTYSETDYEFTLFDFNPLSSVELTNQRVVLVLRPEPLGSTLTQTLYYLVVNEDGLVVDSDINFSLEGLSDTVDNLIQTSGLWYDRNPSGVFWSQPNGADFVNSCTVEGAANADDILILGDIYVRESVSPNALLLNDIRVRGGGIKKDQVSVATSANPEVEWCWDIGKWDGKPFPGAASLFVEVPIDVLDITPSGLFSPENVTEIVNRHMAYGTYAVIHGYNPYVVSISGFDFLPSGVIQLSWTPGPSDTRYNVYSCITEDGDYQLIASGLTETSYTTSGVTSQYYSVLGYPSGTTTAFTEGSIFEIQGVEL